jgi:Rieske Fe-S protein
LNGRNVGGPPPAPLARYGIAIKKNEVIVFVEKT